MGKLVIDGNSVYEIDEECVKKHRVSRDCGIHEKLLELEKKGYYPQPARRSADESAANR